MQKKLGYALLLVSLILFFVVSLQDEGYLVIEIIISLLGLFLLWKNKAPLVATAIAIVIGVFLRFCYYGDFLGLIGKATPPYTRADASPEGYLIYAALALVALGLKFVPKKTV
ncbi:hypothetical protein [Castellaniella sp. MT123]|uniref:hypothetical protein n=1 Tax=Castellaniella sp. MT123 TaxID=3140381 RepID=UPI0031F3D53A